MGKIVALTTSDNPYDPIDDFDKWFMYDNDLGYNSCAYLARIAKTSDLLTPQENEEALETAIDDIVRIDPLGIYQKVSKEATDQELEEYYMEEAAN